MNLEDLVREVLADVAAEVAGPAPAGAGRTVPPPDRAVVALRAARRRRAVVAGTAAAAVLALAGAVAGPVLVGGDPAPAPVGSGPTEPLPPAPADTALRPTDLARTGPYQLTSYGTEGGAAVRLPGTPGFRRLPWRQVAVSPAGRVAVVDTADSSPGTRLGVVDAGRVRWVDLGGPAIHPAWSPDGETVLVTTVTVDSPLGQRDGFALVDTGTWAVRRVGGLLAVGAPALAVSGLDWDPAGDAVVGGADVVTYGDDPAYGLGRWDLDGVPARTVRLPGRPSSVASQVVSPWDGRIAASDGTGVAVVDGRDGTVLSRPSTTATAVYGWRDRTHLVVEDGGGLLLLGLDGRTAPYATGTVRGRAGLTPVG